MTGFTKSKSEWYEEFKRYADLNNDGKVECWELTRFLRLMGMNPTDREVEKIMRDDFKKKTTDTINFDEFYEWVILQPDPIGELYDAFKTFDKDNSGFLDINELKNVMSCISDEGELKEFFTFMDENNDGKIDYKEFVDIFCDDTCGQQSKK